MATLTIGEVSALTGLPTHTLRFYEQEGLFFAPVRRDTAGRRVFTTERKSVSSWPTATGSSRRRS